MNAIVLTTVLVTGVTASASPKPQALSAYQQYAAAAETSFVSRQPTPAIDNAKVVTAADSPVHVEGALIHHWDGTMFVPGVRLATVLRFMQSYNDLPRFYSPEVVESKLLSHRGDDFDMQMQLRKHEVITVVLDTESHIHYGRPDAAHAYSISHMDRVREIPDGDHGFLWRMDTYWRFTETNGGVAMECEVISLTRDVPTGLGWAVNPFISSLPKEELEFTLSHTRDALLQTSHDHTMQIQGRR
jgi:hypothetical protein